MSVSFQKKSQRGVRYIPLTLLILAAVFLSVTAYHFSYNFLDSDASSELILGKLLADQNKILTTDFSYSSELRIFNLNLIYMPLFKVFSNWHTVRYVGMIIMQAMFLGSYYFLSRQMRMSTRAFFLSAALMLLPVNVLYGRFALYQNHYSPAMIFSFLIAGLFLSFVRHQGQKKTGQALRLFALLALAFASCLNGFRQLPAVMIPLFLTALIVLAKNRRGAPDALKNVSKDQWQQLILAAVTLAVGMIGLWIHSRLLSQTYTFIVNDHSIVRLMPASRFRELITAYVSLFGFQEGRTLFSIEGFMALSGVFAAMVFFFVSFGNIVSRDRPGHPTSSFMGIFYPVAILSMTLIFMLTSGNLNYSRYYLTAFVWIFPYLGFWMDRNKLSIRSLTVKKALVILACLCMALNGMFYNLYFLHPDDKQVKYDDTIVHDTAPCLQDVSEFLLENEYEVGYASFWLANVMTEITNGQIAMIPISYQYESPGDIYYYTYLTYRQTREKEFVAGKSIFFLVANVELDLFYQSELISYAIQVYADRNVRVFYFDFDTEVWDYLLQQAIDSNQTTVLEQLLEE